MIVYYSLIKLKKPTTTTTYTQVVQRLNLIQQHAPLLQYNVATATQTTLMGQPRCPMAPQAFWGEDAVTMILENIKYRSLAQDT